MIVTFKCKYTEELWKTGKSRKLPPETLKVALRKLLMIDSAYSLEDLKVPPNNHLEGLQRDRKGQLSIRINNRLRICFIWENKRVYDVEIVDYH